ncbi:MAG: type IV pilus twitching motility protein PilT [Lentisphaerae bacterium]|jgi:twitching motility protein PilT|nr:type IV pilus twitching motility protein PilT [Lentisphaerota bacterium]MBT4819288.1 type IV pilus twitching motility protein PilT [Lentisphaerota bacterium]MBT5610540.1 type IV pilus twitching motility protein PilT [Lentisphaerota bacterium]MBT7054412.1 type IV pilus twitching motility protein PilT [Lentisphaerota bacterium]MBT7842581.1 type IV pilus twitching motility protein PilT [Lentisphaerota bacterium]
MPRIDDFLTAMMELDGSDLHLCVGLPPKIRIHGELEELDEPALTTEDMEGVLKEICPPEKWEFFLENRDLDYAYEIRDVARFRTNYFFNHFGMGCICRIIPTKIKTLEDLHLPQVLKEICEYTSGLALVTGPTGSGKSTTLAAMIDYINVNHHKHIITIEDPIEFVHMNKQSIIVQREVGSDTETFGAALRGSMRADPDIVLVGEMRDLETISLALSCAAMGLLVFGTLHTNNAPKTVDRIIDAFPADEQPQMRAMLAQSLKAVVSQLLCRTADGKGRAAVHEILLYHESLGSTIREGNIPNIRTIIEGNRARGMKTMDSDLLRLLNDDVITPLEAYMKASVKEDFEQFIDKSELAEVMND